MSLRLSRHCVAVKDFVTKIAYEKVRDFCLMERSFPRDDLGGGKCALDRSGSAISREHGWVDPQCRPSNGGNSLAGRSCQWPERCEPVDAFRRFGWAVSGSRALAIGKNQMGAGGHPGKRSSGSKEYLDYPH